MAGCSKAAAKLVHQRIRMAKVKYFYDPRTLSYRKIERSWRQRFRDVGLFLLSSALFAFVFYTLADNLIDSPKEKRLKRELENMVLQYEIMNERMNQVSRVLEDMQFIDDNIYRVIFEADPIPSEVRRAGFGGANRYKNLEGFNNSDLIIYSRKKLDMLTKQAYVQSKSFDDLMDLAKRKDEMMMAIPAIQPVANKDMTRIASGFGYRIHPIYKVSKMHTGVDFTAPVGTPIYATGDGVIDRDEGSNQVGGSGYGLYVVINHGFGYKTLYAHASKIVVKPGQKVKRGDVIAYVGNTGSSTGPHLHYEVIKNGAKINPINFFYNDLTPEEYELMIQLSSSSNQSFD
jgi:murein DD-endopeptidase MepM/ murein hydrolase activator NlpD